MTTNNVRAIAHATFIISGTDVIPDVWTAYFGVRPSRESIKGQRFVLPSEKLSQRPATLGLWGIGSKSIIHSDQLAPHLRYLKSYLALPRGDLRDLAAAQGATVALWCYWFNEPGHGVPDVPDDIRAMMGALGGTIELDEYQ